MQHWNATPGAVTFKLTKATSFYAAAAAAKSMDV